MSTIHERINAAIARITHGHAPMRVPAEETDPDIVLAECAKRIAELEDEHQQLQRALSFWLRPVKGDGSRLDERAAADAFLLTGYLGDPMSEDAFGMMTAPEIRDAIDERNMLRAAAAFVEDVMREYPELGCLDPFDIQELALKCGLLRMEQRVAPCCDNCGCTNHGGEVGEVDCYVVTDALRAARAVGKGP